MTERLIEKLDRLAFEAGINIMTPEMRHFAMLVRADVVAQWPQRIWVGLTDEERLRVLQFIDPKAVRFPLGFKQIAESIERLLKEKNA